MKTLALAIGWALVAGASGKQNFTVDERTYRRLQSAQQALADKNYPKAMEVLERLRRRRGLSEHEHCLRLQTLAVLHAERRDYPKAIATLQEALTLGALPQDTLLAMRFNLGQLLFATEQVEAAVKELVRWDKDAPRPSPGALYTIAVAHARLERFKPALRYVDRALAASPDRAPQESWLRLKLASLVKLERPQAALPVMSALIRRRPNDGTRWRQLSALYSQVGEDQLAVAALELAYARGLLERSSDVRILAENLAALGAPAKAARVLEAALEKKILPPDAENLMLVARFHLAARERSSAREPLTRAGRMTRDGKPDVELARLEAGARRWRASLRSAARALEKGGLKQPGEAHLMMGVARHRLGRRDAAKQAFRAAARFPAQARAAKGWLQFLGG